MGLKKLVKQALYHKNSIRYEKELSKRRNAYQDWVEALEEAMAAGEYREEAGQVEADRGADASGREDVQKNPSGQQSSQGQFLLLCNPRGQVADRANQWIADWFAKHPETVVLYGDEDVRDTGIRTSPYFKPDWSPDLLEHLFFPGSLVAVRKDWLEACGGELRDLVSALAIGGKEPGLGVVSPEACAEKPDSGVVSPEAYAEKLPDERDFIKCRNAFQEVTRRILERSGGWEKGVGRLRIAHFPGILFHDQSEESRALWLECAKETEGSGAAGESQKSDGTSDLAESFHGDRRDADEGLLSVIIPSKDNPEILEKCITSVIDAAEGLEYEIIVVDNGSASEEKVRIGKFLEGLQTGPKQIGNPVRVVYHYEPREFNFSWMCNKGAENADGKHLLFLNDDVEIVTPGDLRKMAECVARPHVGAVGIKLLYPPKSGERSLIQHAGIVNLPMGPVHKLQFCGDDSVYYFGWNRGKRNVLAVTGACLMVERDKFYEAGGFSEELAVAFNDVDLCFRLYELGYENVCDCDIFAYHDESYSRGDDESPEKLARLLREREKLYSRHPELSGKDPYYSVYLNREELDTHIRPLYETAGNRIQSVERQGELLEETEGARNWEACRNACLLVRVESALTDREIGKKLCLTGWSVVLGDNNACYEKELVFRQDTEEPRYYALKLEGQYRPDLVENMPDQTNVGLCGYKVELAKGLLPEGRYLVGIAARNRVNGMLLTNWSNRIVEM